MHQLGTTVNKSSRCFDAPHEKIDSMATTIPQAFRKLKSNLEITGLQQSTVSTRQQNVRRVLEKDLKVIESFLTGSYSRSTMIAPLSEADIDVFTVLDVSYFHHYNGQNGGPAGLLDRVRRTLLKTYTRTPSVSRNGQAVTIRFTDFTVDVVPAFRRSGGGYIIPNSLTNYWLETDPKKHVQLISSANSDHNGDLVPLIKMIKGWNKMHGAFFRSFHLEVLALSILNRVRIDDYPSGVRFYFDKGRGLISQENPDPAGYGDDVGKYINTGEKIRQAVAKFEKAYENSLKAEDYAKQGRIRESIATWSKVFDGYFPAYD